MVCYNRMLPGWKFLQPKKHSFIFFFPSVLYFYELAEISSSFYPRLYGTLIGSFICKALKSVLIYTRDHSKEEFTKDLENSYQRQQVIIAKNENEKQYWSHK